MSLVLHNESISAADELRSGPLSIPLESSLVKSDSSKTLSAKKDVPMPTNAKQVNEEEEEKRQDDDSTSKLEDVQELAKETDNRNTSHEYRQWNPSATLYCQTNGHSHADLVNFGINSCPTCLQELDRIGSPLDREKDTKGAAESGSEHAKIGSSVEYRDTGGYLIETVDWGHPFKLETEVEEILREKSIQDKETIFRVITVLRTTIPADSNRYSFETRAIMKRGIIGNSTISVTIQSLKLIITSRLFIDALKSVVSYDTGDLLEGEELKLCEPYSVIGHHLEELKTYMRKFDKIATNGVGKNSTEGATSAAATGSEQTIDQRTHSHVSLIFNFVSEALNNLIAQELARYQKDPRMCTFRMLWFHFRPGRMVYVTSDGTKDAYMVDSVDMGECSLSCPFEYLENCSISLWHLDFNGRYLTRVREKVTIQPFNDELSFASLDVVPCEIWDEKDGGALRTELEDRGKKWVSHLLGKQVEYSGHPTQLGKKLAEGRAYVDCASYYDLDSSPDFEPLVSLDDPTENHSWGCRCNACDERGVDTKKRNTKLTRYDNIDIKTINSSTDPVLSTREIYLLCPRQLKAFMFNTRIWQTLDVRFCQPCKPNKAPFERLVMPEERKLMIKALVYKYTDPRYAGGNLQQVWGADFVKNKGEGQIFLFHGGPGVGKTFTAECIAEFTGRPLLALTCGDIGTEEVTMEKKLRDWLKLAHKWGAVMLIDEADVFLEKRMDADVKRNSLVSVFLREIEYYQGILFLTSNRVGRFDDAFISRIHVVIHYRDLDDEYREKIWNQFFDKLEAERGETMRIDQSARRYVLGNSRILAVKWNGREIRNAFQTAVALAEYRFVTKPELEKSEGEIAVLEEKDFKQICDMTIRFKEYLMDVNDGMDEQHRAQQDRARVVYDEES